MNNYRISWVIIYLNEFPCFEKHLLVFKSMYFIKRNFCIPKIQTVFIFKIYLDLLIGIKINNISFIKQSTKIKNWD